MTAPVLNRASLLTPGAWLVLVSVLTLIFAFLSGMTLVTVAYRDGYMAGQRQADQEAVYAAVGDALRVGTRVAGLTDSLSDLRRSLARQALARLPQRVVDSLREVRWTTP